MKSFIKMAAILLLQLVLVAGFVFASGDQEGTTGSSGELMEISLVNWDLSTSFPEGEVDDPMRDWFEEKFNIVLKPYSVTWGDWTEKINIWAASGELPDIIGPVATVGTGQYFQWIEDGVVRALPDDLGAYPNVANYVGKPEVQAYNVDGMTYILPRMTYEDSSWWCMDRGLTVRKDWMEKLGISDPTTEQEFIDMCVAFVTQDPDGNGKDDTIGLAVNRLGFLYSQGFTNYGFTDNRWVKQADGTYQLAVTTRDALDAYSFYRRLYKAGGLDPDFAANEDQGISLFASGRAGVLLRQVSSKHYNSIHTEWGKLQPEKDFFASTKILNPPAIPGKDYVGFVEKAYWSETYIEGGVDDAKMDRILQLYDYMYSEEGLLINMFGFEGEDYVKTDTGVKLLKTNADGVAQTAGDLYPIMSGGFSYLAVWNGDLVQYVNPAIPEPIRTYTAEVRDYRLKNYKRPDVDWAVQAINVPEKQQMSIPWTADWTQFIIDDTDATDEELYQELLKNWEAAGYNATAAAVNKAAKAMGK